MEQLRKFARYFRPYRWTIVAGIFFILLSMSFGLMIPSLVGAAVDDLALGITWNKIIYYPLLIVGANLVSGFFLFWQRRLLINTSRHIEFDMRQDFYAALVNQPLRFFQQTRIGDLMARATNDLAAVRQIVGPMILYSFQAVFALAITIPILMNISVKLTLLMLIPLPFVSLTVKYLGQKIHVRFEKIQEFFSDIVARAQENLTGVRVVRAYAQEKAEIAKFEELNREYAGRNLNLVKYAAAMRPLLFFFIGLGFVIVVAVGVPMAIEGEITAGDFTAFILYLQRMIWYLIALGYVVNLYQRGTASLKRFNAILETEPEIRDGGDVREQARIKGGIEFRGLSYSYNGKPAIRNIDISIRPGETVAFVGRTGSGKSTLLHLVPRLLDPPEGTLFIDGTEARSFPIRQLRRAIGFVPQETFLFSDSLENNIAFGVDDIDRPNGKPQWPDRTMSPARAAEAAGLAEDIKGFPGQYRQLVGERGITLSGGQKQRTAIARAIMRDPAILILDDALSAVDTFTEETILNNLREIRKGRTTLIAAHRISTIRDADQIIVLDQGEIIEQGSHEKLIALNGQYADLYRRQLLEEEIEATE
ncbi:MAG TPA: ABC transporter ATP-binding protein [Pyrinomonadaceae bacterium]|nr:ABC transporter ATP-binding protein [Pyrinomonadaceae bacterium]HMP66973.1 ABC transporter ATP-binding protein [Pyrinomonadaceae bacterium]